MSILNNYNTRVDYLIDQFNVQSKRSLTKGKNPYESAVFLQIQNFLQCMSQQEIDKTLLLSVQKDSSFLAHYLLEVHHADPNIMDFLPLKTALAYKQLLMTKVLIHGGATFADNSELPVVAIKAGDTKILNFLLKYLNKESQSDAKIKYRYKCVKNIKRIQNALQDVFKETLKN